METKPVAELRDPEIVVAPAELKFDVGFVVLVVFELEGGKELVGELFVGVVLDVPEGSGESDPLGEVNELLLNT